MELGGPAVERRPMRATLLLAGLLASALAAGSALLAPVTLLPLGIARPEAAPLIASVCGAGAALALRRPRWALLLFGVTCAALALRALVAPSAAGGYWALVVVLLTGLAWRAVAEESRSR
jgi:hypothetical protein